MTSKEKPILFSGPMVRAILDGRKTQTRRIVKDPARIGCLTGDCPHTNQSDCIRDITVFGATQCPYGNEMDRLWVRETFAAPWGLDYKFPGGESGILYRADNPKKFPDDGTWKPSIFMPRAASRITLEITAVRVERLQDISEQDAIAEGISNIGPCRSVGWQDYSGGPGFMRPIKSYKSLWESINGKGSWAANPWVWVIEFKKYEH